MLKIEGRIDRRRIKTHRKIGEERKTRSELYVVKSHNSMLTAYHLDFYQFIPVSGNINNASLL